MSTPTDRDESMLWLASPSPQGELPIRGLSDLEIHLTSNYTVEVTHRDAPHMVLWSGDIPDACELARQLLSVVAAATSRSSPSTPRLVA